MREGRMIGPKPPTEQMKDEIFLLDRAWAAYRWPLCHPQACSNQARIAI